MAFMVSVGGWQRRGRCRFETRRIDKGRSKNYQRVWFFEGRVGYLSPKYRSFYHDCSWTWPSPPIKYEYSTKQRSWFIFEFFMSFFIWKFVQEKAGAADGAWGRKISALQFYDKSLRRSWAFSTRMTVFSSLCGSSVELPGNILCPCLFSSLRMKSSEIS